MKPGDQLDYLWHYKWSSLPGYINAANRLEMIDYATVLAEYGGVNRTGRMGYQNQIAEDLGRGLPIKKQIVGQSILGSDDFVTWVKETFLEKDKERELPDIGKIHRYLSREAVFSVLAAKLDISFDSILTTTGKERQIVMTMLYKYAGLNNREIGEFLGVDYSTVSQGRKRLRERSDKDEKTSQLLHEIEAVLSQIKI